MKYPWMPLFWGDFLANTMHLSAQEAGAYLFLIAHAWEHEGEIPGDRIRLARIAHVRPDQWSKVWRALQDFFEIKAGGPSNDRPTVRCYTHHRVTDELHRLGKISNKRKEAALANAQQMQSKSSANGGANALTSTSTSNRESSSGKVGEAPSMHVQVNYRDKGVDYRAPPAKKSDNAAGAPTRQAGATSADGPKRGRREETISRNLRGTQNHPCRNAQRGRMRQPQKKRDASRSDVQKQARNIRRRVAAAWLKLCCSATI